jgi:hypothetical protein
MLAVNKQYKSPAQRKGERALRDRNLWLSPSAINNIEVVKRKARANRLKEEYNRKYLKRVDLLVRAFRHRTHPLIVEIPCSLSSKEL